MLQVGKLSPSSPVLAQRQATHQHFAVPAPHSACVAHIIGAAAQPLQPLLKVTRARYWKLLAISHSLRAAAQGCGLCVRAACMDGENMVQKTPVNAAKRTAHPLAFCSVDSGWSSCSSIPSPVGRFHLAAAALSLALSVFPAAVSKPGSLRSMKKDR